MAPVYSALFFSLSIYSALANAQNSTSYTDDKEFQDTILSTANRIRAAHDASDLTWNDTLAGSASDWAQKCNFQYDGKPSGQIMSMRFPDVQAAVEAWGNESQRYNFDDPGFSFDTNHFTQLVWKGSESIGCARQYCGDAPRDDDDFDDRWDHPDYDAHDEYSRADDRHDPDDRDDRDRDGSGGDRDNEPGEDCDGPNDDDCVRPRAALRNRRRRHDGDHDDNDNCDPGDDGDDDCRNDQRGPNNTDDKAREWFVVCYFSPPGNILGADNFRDNVVRSTNGSNGSGGNGSGSGGSNSSGDGSGASQNPDNAATSRGLAKSVALLGLVAGVVGMM